MLFGCVEYFNDIVILKRTKNRNEIDEFSEIFFQIFFLHNLEITYQLRTCIITYNIVVVPYLSKIDFQKNRNLRVPVPYHTVSKEISWNNMGIA